MFGPSIKHVFKSRWHALVWSVFILLTAYCTVPSTDEANTPVDAAVSVLTKHAGHGRETGRHANPWAKEPG